MLNTQKHAINVQIDYQQYLIKNSLCIHNFILSLRIFFKKEFYMEITCLIRWGPLISFLLCTYVTLDVIKIGYVRAYTYYILCICIYFFLYNSTCQSRGSIRMYSVFKWCVTYNLLPMLRCWMMMKKFHQFEFTDKLRDALYA